MKKLITVVKKGVCEGMILCVCYHRYNAISFPVFLFSEIRIGVENSEWLIERLPKNGKTLLSVAEISCYPSFSPVRANFCCLKSSWSPTT